MASQSPLSQVTEQLEQIVSLHGFTIINIGLNTKQSDEYRYDCTLHFDDPKPGEHGCAMGNGATIGKAVNEAYRASLAKRLNASVSLVAEAA